MIIFLWDGDYTKLDVKYTNQPLIGLRLKGGLERTLEHLGHIHLEANQFQFQHSITRPAVQGLPILQHVQWLMPNACQ
jgi:hypothetical protein